MKFHPISLNVIRQALSLSGYPRPVRIEFDAQQKFPSGAVVTAYSVYFEMFDVRDALRLNGYPSQEQCSDFVKRMNTAFCNDIFPTGWDTSRNSKYLIVQVCTRLEKVLRDAETRWHEHTPCR